MTAVAIDSVLRRLDAMAASTYRQEFRHTAIMARRVIRQLCLAASGEKRVRRLIADQISDAANVRPVTVYTTKKTGQIRWMRADAPSLARIPESQIIGTYDYLADVRHIAADLEGEA